METTEQRELTPKIWDHVFKVEEVGDGEVRLIIKHSQITRITNSVIETEFIKSEEHAEYIAKQMSRHPRVENSFRRT